MNRPVHRATGDATVPRNDRRALALAILRKALDEIAPYPLPRDDSTAPAIEFFERRTAAAQKLRNEKQAKMEARHQSELAALRAKLQSGDAPTPRHHYHPARWRYARALARHASDDLLNSALAWFSHDLTQVALQCARAEIEPLALYSQIGRRLRLAEKQSDRIEQIISSLDNGQTLEDLAEQWEEGRRSA